MADEGEERNLPPSGQKLARARQEGNIARSPELSMACGLFFAFICLKFLSPWMLKVFTIFMENIFKNMSHPDFTQAGIYKLSIDFSVAFFSITLPLLCLTIVLNLIVSYAQVGEFMFTFHPLKPKLDGLNPVNGFRRLFSLDKLVELLKSILKMIIVGFIGYKFLKENIPSILTMEITSPLMYITTLGHLVYKIAMKIIPVYLFISILDYVYRRYQYWKSLMMSRTEVKEEAKKSENPEIKSAIRKRRMQLYKKLSLKQVPTASVVVTNPDHLAVAIRYEYDIMDAPVVVAKGADLIAQKIKEIAKKHKIPVVENKPLARSLYEVEVNDFIPAELYMAVAKIIVHISSTGKYADKSGGGVK
ncbi:MAG: EscU/YscU/HrcU family type III secretion system export apparatus switch protein [Candidatus Eremiobacterota bacterium]